MPANSSSMPYRTRSKKFVLFIHEYVWCGDGECELGKVVIDEAIFMIVQPYFLKENDFETTEFNEIGEVTIVSPKSFNIKAQHV